jgi:hypothetical protein
MDKLKQAELSEIALEIINLSEEIMNDHPRYRTISFMERIVIATKILELHESQAKCIALLQIDDSLNDLIYNFEYLNSQKYK